MKKILLILLVAILPCVLVADEIGEKEIIMVYYSSPSNALGNKHRMPMNPIYVYQKENLFSFGKQVVGCTVLVIKEGVPCFSNIISDEGTMQIPKNLSGEVELRLVIGNYIYHAMIKL